jgi:ArsR family transcriptional regulator
LKKNLEMAKAKDFDIELFFSALADKTRLRLLNLIGDDEVCVCFLLLVIGTNQPKISAPGISGSGRDW